MEKVEILLSMERGQAIDCSRTKRVCPNDDE